MNSLRSLFSELFPSRETLQKIKLNQESKIREIIQRRKIEYFVHFTRIDNLSSILKHGLVPVSLQQEKKISSLRNDDQRIDSQLDCTSCSIMHPNYKLFYTFRKYKFPNNKWVIIVLDPEVLFSPTNITYYCHTNAAGVFPKIHSVKELCTASSFENMFCETATTKDNVAIKRSSLHIEDCLPTDPQAEILISDIIDTKYIACVCFETQSDINSYLQNESNSLDDYDYESVPGFFKPRKDYMSWRKEQNGN